MSVEETPQTGEVRKWNQLCSRSDSIQKSEGSYQKSRMDKKDVSDLLGGFCNALWAGWKDLFLQR